ncbi:hypothetical protein RFI_14613 [Reticulomyxa filosa]|uniref:EF-hand domain-containing protein n=1 Tax=Reticulomyxa filosa TaxID=46433 RepID=X6N953_RETFI|nr:hypothetical protein RFI_14613 [Reticulomyxa filosa]|eukprot:ETO22581.1 hypothetical protein RFI_14613 [Reticulomyxa filosa]
MCLWTNKQTKKKDLSYDLILTSELDSRLKKNNTIYSWIFETQSPNYLTATSVGGALEETEQSQDCPQSITESFSSSKVYTSLAAVNHSNKEIAVISKEVISVHGLDRLNKNGAPRRIHVPLSYPWVVAGRLSSKGFLDWTIVTSVDVDELSNPVRDDTVMTFFINAIVIIIFVYVLEMLKEQPVTVEQLGFVIALACLLTMTVGLLQVPTAGLEISLGAIAALIFALGLPVGLRMLLIQITQQQKEQQTEPTKESFMDDESANRNVKFETIRSFDIKNCFGHTHYIYIYIYNVYVQSTFVIIRMCMCIRICTTSGAMTTEWIRIRKRHRGPIAVDSVNEYFGRCAVLFLRAKERYNTRSIVEDCEVHIQMGQIFCVKELDLFSLKEYFNMAVKTAMLAFLVTGAWDAPWVWWTRSALLAFLWADIIIQVIVVVLLPKTPMATLRCQRCTCQWYNFPEWERLAVYLSLLIFFAADCACALTSGLRLSSYVPLEGLLLIIRVDQLYQFVQDFAKAIFKARDVLLVWFCVVLFAACVGVALLRKAINADKLTNNFVELAPALLTSFAFVTTGENYPDLIYGEKSGRPTLEILLYSMTLVVIGLFVLIPIVINRFQESFGQSREFYEEKMETQKNEALEATFLMIDTNGDKKIFKKEMYNLVRWCHFLSEKVL